ncbi:MAG: cell division protein FtsA, partial [Proteobacteria bacterium]|nr:cell division protein FtsA [Pseudomonadota bacterium]
MKARLSNFVAFDLGSSKIAALAAIVDKKGEVRIVSQSLYHSHGFRSGRVTDVKKAEASIINAIYALEKDCSKNFNRITLSLSGAGTKSFYIYSKIKIPEPQISKQDIKKLIHKILIEFKVKDHEVIHYFPVEFNVDDNACVDNPIGMFGKELGCQMHIVCVNSALLANLANCFIKCQVEISEVTLAIYASGLACLSEEEKNLGTLIIDIGAFTSSYGVFLFDKLV